MLLVRERLSLAIQISKDSYIAFTLELPRHQWIKKIQLKPLNYFSDNTYLWKVERNSLRFNITVNLFVEMMDFVTSDSLWTISVSLSLRDVVEMF